MAEAVPKLSEDEARRSVGLNASKLKIYVTMRGWRAGCEVRYLGYITTDPAPWDGGASSDLKKRTGRYPPNP